MLNKMSARTVATLMREDAKPGRHGDGGGLYLSVGPGGARRWVFLFRWRGKLKEMGLGSARSVSLAKARERAAGARETVAEGVNPIAARRASAAIPEFGAFAVEVVESLAPQWRNPKHREQWKATLANDAAALSHMSLDRIETEDVLGVLKPIWSDKPETASRLRGRIERVLDAAKAKGYRDGENPARWKGHLANLLPARQKLTRGHHPAMPYAEAPEFCDALKKREGVSARALEFLILTAARSGEVRGARWSEMDLQKQIWTVPADRMKAGKAHRVPLTAEAVAILEAIKPLTGGEPDALVFPGTKGKPLSDMSLAAVLRRMKIPASKASVHGFRSSFRDWAGEASTFPRELAEAALAHAVGDAVERAYRRGDALEKRRRMMEAWASQLVRAPAQIITISGGVGR